MSDGDALIISRDGQLVEELRSILEVEPGCQLQHETGMNGLRGDWNVAFLDLRSESAWEGLQQLRENRGQFACGRFPIIGIVEEGVTPERVHTVETLLAGALALPIERDRVARLLRVAHSGEWRRRAETMISPRVLEGLTRRYMTFTPELFKVVDDLEVAAKSDFTILLVGETGTGKTFMARLIHELSQRSTGRFMTVACGALPNDLIDSELFGHVKGAFTGADRNKDGKFEAAEGGTILLDEIDVLGLEQQAKLLRVLETGEYEPVGSNETRVTNTRTIVASNLSLEDLIEQDRFRSDLYFRLKQVRFDILPLRKRPLDIVPLAMNMIEECCRQHNLLVRHVHPDFLDVLRHYSWPGNIREMRNEVRRAVLFCRGGVLTPELLSPGVVADAFERRDDADCCTVHVGLAGHVAQTEQETIEQMLQTQNFNRAATARALGISRVTLYNKIRKYRIQIDPGKAG